MLDPPAQQLLLSQTEEGLAVSRSRPVRWKARPMNSEARVGRGAVPWRCVGERTEIVSERELSVRGARREGPCLAGVTRVGPAAAGRSRSLTDRSCVGLQ